MAKKIWTFQDEDPLAQVERILRQRFGRRGMNDLENLEDCVQEGVIRAWKDIQAGTYDDYHIVNRAYEWARAAMAEETRYTGHIQLTRDGQTTAAADAHREKVRQYTREYHDLHGKRPSQQQISQGTGLKSRHVNHIVKNLDRGLAVQGEISYSERRRQNSSLEGMIESLQERTNDGNMPVWKNAPKEEFESDLVQSMSLVEALRTLTERQRDSVYLYYYEGWTQSEIGTRWGVAQFTISQELKRALKRLREVMSAEVKV